jgi:tRNA U34 2-thiouridine synthase MnmA/TrmU
MSRAIGIFSGGLDSMLAVELLRRQGVEVLAVTFETPFFGSERARQSAQLLSVDHRVADITAEHLEVVLAPRFGRGRHMNPCKDCHALMFRKAGEILDREAYDFLFSGEVLGQRPFSQNPRALQEVARASGRPELIVRPLSALCLPPSGPEQRGLVDRSRLLGLRGRSRKPQMELARQWGLHSYPSPAGGCLLTDPSFSRRLADLLEREPVWTERDLRLLTLGRHLRPPSGGKMVVGRNERENGRLEEMAGPDDILLWAAEQPGPTLLIPHGGSPERVALGAGLCLRYGGTPEGAPRPVRARQGGREWLLEAAPCPPREAESWLI